MLFSEPGASPCGSWPQAGPKTSALVVTPVGGRGGGRRRAEAAAERARPWPARAALGAAVPPQAASATVRAAITPMVDSRWVCRTGVPPRTGSVTPNLTWSIRNRAKPGSTFSITAWLRRTNEADRPGQTAVDQPKELGGGEDHGGPAGWRRPGSDRRGSRSGSPRRGRWPGLHGVAARRQRRTRRATSARCPRFTSVASSARCHGPPSIRTSTRSMPVGCDQAIPATVTRPAGTEREAAREVDPRLGLDRRPLRPSRAAASRPGRGAERGELQVGDPLGGRHVPVEARHHHPHREAVLGRQRLAVHPDREHRAAVRLQHDVDRGAGGPAVDAGAEQLVGPGPDAGLQQDARAGRRR